MEPNWAEENLQVIRTLMERTALYRRALAPVMLTTGMIGVVAAALGPLIAGNRLKGFLCYWSTVGLVAVVASLWISRRQAVKVKEPFWSGPTKRIVAAMLPPLLVGGILTLAVGAEYADVSARGVGLILNVLWWAFYGCALHSAALHVSRGMRRLALGFIGAPIALIAIAFINPVNGADLPASTPHWLMGLTFGGFHLVAGIYLYFTEKSRNAQ